MTSSWIDEGARIGLSALITGTAASLVTTAALALLARQESKSVFQPVNATSHWLHGPRAGRRRSPDARHTLVGYATHHASAIFWALPFQAWLASRPRRNGAELLLDATVMSAIAAVIDYGVVPKRLTPGWELALSNRAIAATYGAMALGLTAGAMIERALLGAPRRR